MIKAGLFTSESLAWIRHFCVFFLLLNVSISPVFLPWANALPTVSAANKAREAIKAMEEVSSPLHVTISPNTGLATFLSTKQPGQGIPISAPAFGSPQERASSFLKEFGSTFGIQTPSEFQTLQVQGPDEVGMEHVRIQQMFKGIPITGGQLTVHMRGPLVTAVLSKTLGNIEQITTTPTVDPVEALTAARQLVEKYYEVTTAVFSQPRLEIFNRGLLDGSVLPTQLAWFIEAKAPNIREFIWIDAHTKRHLLNFSQLTDARNRQVYDAASGSSLPGTPCRSEGGGVSGNVDCNDAYDYSGDMYDYFFNNHGRDSYDGAGATIASTVDYCPTPGKCPYASAFWNGSQMVYGDGFSAADDIVAHELTHAVTEYSANLFYYMQSGALNESYSDIFGETIDLTNSGGTDTPAVRWQLGEDVPGIGAIRNMMTPTLFNDPGKVSDSQFFCSTTVLRGSDDNGGVHINSGVPNHAYALMVDGGSYNGQTITGIGLAKAGKIQYRALTQYLTSASNFLDNYNALKQACSDLIGTNGITAGDCSEVNNALDAVEMADPWPCSPAQANVPHLCPLPETPTNLFFDNLENTSSGNWTVYTLGGTAHWYYPGASNPFGIGPFATSGVVNFWGHDHPDIADSVVEMTGDVAIPATGALMQFNHAYFFENNSTSFFDGGVVEYSTNGGATWLDAGSMIIAGQTYGGTISSSSGNPLGGQSAFVSDSFGYTASQLNLSSLAGQNVRFRFRIGTDSSIDDLGWFIDDIRVYECENFVVDISIWVDFNYVGTELGTLSQPYNTLAEAIEAVAVGGTITIKAGITSETFDGINKINKNVTIKSSGGTAVIGKQ